MIILLIVGKSFVAKKVATQLISIGHKVALCLPAPGESGEKRSQNSFEAEGALEINYYNPEQHLSKRASLQSIAGFVDDVDYMILELPPLQTYLTSHSVLREIDVCLLISRANRSWSTSDSKMLENIKFTNH